MGGFKPLHGSQTAIGKTRRRPHPRGDWSVPQKEASKLVDFPNKLFYQFEWLLFFGFFVGFQLTSAVYWPLVGMAAPKLLKTFQINMFSLFCRFSLWNYLGLKSYSSRSLNHAASRSTFLFLQRRHCFKHLSRKPKEVPAKAAFSGRASMDTLLNLHHPLYPVLIHPRAPGVGIKMRRFGFQHHLMQNVELGSRSPETLPTTHRCGCQRHIGCQEDVSHHTFVILLQLRQEGPARSKKPDPWISSPHTKD